MERKTKSKQKLRKLATRRSSSVRSASKSKASASKAAVIAERLGAQADEEISSRDTLILKYRSYVHGLVGKLIQAMGLPAEAEEDYIAAGYVGLVEAAERFDQKSGVDFKTFAYLRIRGAIIDSIRRSSDLSGKAYRCAKALAAAHDLQEGRLVQSATVLSKDSAAVQDVALAEILDFAAKGALAFRLSSGSDEQPISKLPSSHGNPEEILEKRQTQEEVHTFIATLPEKERKVVEDYYLRGKSFVEIAESYEGMSKSWISRLHARALELLKVRMLSAAQPVAP